jgi:iron complex transport system ATP-binding protein
VQHDVNHACRYASHLVAMTNGVIVASGHPQHIVDVPLIETGFKLPCIVIPDPISQTPMIVPTRKGAG